VWRRDGGLVIALDSDTIRPNKWATGAPARSWITGDEPAWQGALAADGMALPCGDCAGEALRARRGNGDHTQFTACVDQLEAELARLAETERVLMERFRHRGTLPPVYSDNRERLSDAGALVVLPDVALLLTGGPLKASPRIPAIFSLLPIST
jgi:hypothetical protein